MRVLLLLVLTAVIAGGCGGDFRRGATSSPSAEEAVQNSAGAPAARNMAIERKIVYTFSLDVVVSQFDGVQSAVEQAVKQFPGSFVSEATLSGSKGMHRRGQWTIRVPQAKHEEMIAALRGLGEVTKENKKSEEVTEEYYDLAARLKNKKETEKRLLKIQEERAGDLEQVLASEREVSRVREEIERMEGQLNRLDNLTSLTTVVLSVSEIRAYQATAELAFMSRVSGAWSDSLQELRQFGQGLAIFCVAITPWLPIWIALGFVIRFLWRRLLPRKKYPSTMPAAPPAAAG